MKKIPLKIKIGLKEVLPAPLQASKNRKVADPSLFLSSDPHKWEQAYQQVMDKKYAKGTRNYSKKIVVPPWLPWQGKGDPPVYIIPRQRGGPSYKKHLLEGAQASDLQYCLISKGFPMQDLSSFTLGPIVGEGLCLVNSAFSKSICVEHIEGGGRCDLSHKNFWRRASKPDRKISLINEKQMLVDGQVVDIKTWLKDNEKLWL